jgi:virginiamycin B lyase
MFAVARVRTPMTLLALAAGSLLAAGAAFSQQSLPPGPGRDLVAAKCYACHTFEARVGNGYTAEGWDTVMRMMSNHGLVLTPTEVAQMKPYLVQNFPERNKVPAVLVPGPLQVSMQVFKAGITPGSRPHDPLATRDGAIWYTGQMVNALGRVDPKTGGVKEFALKTAHSGPHGLVEDRQGNIWYTGNAGALVGKLDPRSGAVTEYKMPEGKGDPHTLQFDRNGMLWFTAQNANQVGRLDPRTGEIKLVSMPTSGARPYGMAFDPRGNLFIVEFGTNGVAMVNPDTMAVREYKLPDPGARPRRVTVTPDNKVWYTDYARGTIGRLDPASGEVKEWPSPSGAKSAPYGISAIGDVIWYSESETVPNTVVRFDPTTETFQSWAIPGGGNIVRNTSVTSEGDFVLANSLANAVTLVKIPR